MRQHWRFKIASILVSSTIRLVIKLLIAHCIIFALLKLGEMFIACGILYGVDSTTVRSTKIRLALDLYEKKVLDVDINFSNPFNNTSTIGYNFLTKDLYTWSMGNQLTYPVKINALGTNVTAEPPIEQLVAAGVSYSITRKNSP